MKYIVTKESKTSWFVNVLRFLRLKTKRKVFFIDLGETSFEKGDILQIDFPTTDSPSEAVLIIKKEA